MLYFTNYQRNDMHTSYAQHSVIHFIQQPIMGSLLMIVKEECPPLPPADRSNCSRIAVWPITELPADWHYTYFSIRFIITN